MSKNNTKVCRNVRTKSGSGALGLRYPRASCFMTPSDVAASSSEAAREDQGVAFAPLLGANSLGSDDKACISARSCGRFGEPHDTVKVTSPGTRSRAPSSRANTASAAACPDFIQTGPGQAGGCAGRELATSALLVAAGRS